MLSWGEGGGSAELGGLFAELCENYSQLCAVDAGVRDKVC